MTTIEYGFFYFRILYCIIDLLFPMVDTFWMPICKATAPNLLYSAAQLRSSIPFPKEYKECSSIYIDDTLLVFWGKEKAKSLELK